MSSAPTLDASALISVMRGISMVLCTLVGTVVDRHQSFSYSDYSNIPIVGLMCSFIICPPPECLFVNKNTQLVYHSLKRMYEPSRLEFHQLEISRVVCTCM